MFQQAQGVLRKVVWSGSDKVTKDPHVCTYLVDGKDYRLEMRDYSLGENVGI